MEHPKNVIITMSGWFLFNLGNSRAVISCINRKLKKEIEHMSCLYITRIELIFKLLWANFVPRSSVIICWHWLYCVFRQNKYRSFILHTAESMHFLLLIAIAMFFFLHVFFFLSFLSLLWCCFVGGVVWCCYFVSSIQFIVNLLRCLEYRVLRFKWKLQEEQQ